MNLGEMNATPLPPVDLRPIYLTVEQAAAIVQIKPKTLYGWWKTDAAMPALKIGGALRFPRERWLKWLQEREQGRPRPRRVQLPGNPA